MQLENTNSKANVTVSGTLQPRLTREIWSPLRDVASFDSVTAATSSPGTTLSTTFGALARASELASGSSGETTDSTTLSRTVDPVGFFESSGSVAPLAPDFFAAFPPRAWSLVAVGSGPTSSEVTGATSSPPSGALSSSAIGAGASDSTEPARVRFRATAVLVADSFELAGAAPSSLLTDDDLPLLNTGDAGTTGGAVSSDVAEFDRVLLISLKPDAMLLSLTLTAAVSHLPSTKCHKNKHDTNVCKLTRPTNTVTNRIRGHYGSIDSCM